MRYRMYTKLNEVGENQFRVDVRVNDECENATMLLADQSFDSLPIHGTVTINVDIGTSSKEIQLKHMSVFKRGDEFFVKTRNLRFIECEED